MYRLVCICFFLFYRHEFGSSHKLKQPTVKSAIVPLDILLNHTNPNSPSIFFVWVVNLYIYIFFDIPLQLQDNNKYVRGIERTYLAERLRQGTVTRRTRVRFLTTPVTRGAVFAILFVLIFLLINRAPFCQHFNQHRPLAPCFTPYLHC
jgi:hypothetical protein